MRKLIMLAAMVAMVMLVAAAPVMADTVLRTTAVLNQVNEGDQIARNTADQDATASQYQYNPGGAGGAGGDAVQFGLPLQPNFVIGGGGGAGGAGGTGSQYQYQNQTQDQTATATGPTFSAEQDQVGHNRVL